MKQSESKFSQLQPPPPPILIIRCKTLAETYFGSEKEIVRIDMSDTDILKKSIDFDYFDMAITISFEHFRDDEDMIKMFSPGTWFAFGVAGFRNKEHFRNFQSPEEIHERYDDLMEIHGIWTIPHTDTKRKWVVLGRIR